MNKIISNILIVSGGTGGPATYSRILYERLPSLGYEVKLINFKDVLKYPKLIRHFIFFFQILKLSKRVDIIYAQDPVSVGLPSYFASKVSGKRLFLKIVGDYAWEQGVQRFDVKDLLDDFVNKEYKSFGIRFLRFIQIMVANGAEKIIVPSNYLKGVVGKWGIGSEKILVIHNSFKSEDIEDSKEKLREKYNISFPSIVSASRLVPWKNIDILIKFFAIFKEKFPSAKLYIIDIGPELDNLKKISKDLNINDSVIFLGKLNHKEVMERIKASDIFALISSYEGFSHLLLESLSLGTPIITTKVGGNSELIKDGENGIFVNLRDVDDTSRKIVDLIGDEELLRKLSKNGLSSVSWFSEEKMLETLSLVLR